MIRRPPRSTLFPYTSSSDLRGLSPRGGLGPRVRALRALALPLILSALHDVDERALALESRVLVPRSEVHTSELQSPCNLVYRLLLEKNIRAIRGRRLSGAAS